MGDARILVCCQSHKHECPDEDFTRQIAVIDVENQTAHSAAQILRAMGMKTWTMGAQVGGA